MAENKNRDGEEPQGIKVTDRRQFTASGERREPDAPRESSSTQSEPLNQPAAAAAPAASRASASAPAASNSETNQHKANDAHDSADQPSIDFVAFVNSLYMSALMALGEVPYPDTGQRETNLDIAQQNIDILLMLHSKTRGNLTPAEDDFLSRALPQLQMIYVRKAR